jgi:STIMATE family
MGIFPILMNVVQFWLIDSIVKASASMYTDEGTRSTDDASHQPLFHEPDSDDDNDGETLRSQRRHDIETPPTPQQKYSERDSGAIENKSMASGSSTTLVESSSMNHSYPPERSTSAANVIAYTGPISPDSASTSSSTSSFRSKRSKRRSPPPPIKRPPPQLSNGTHYTISDTPSPTVSKYNQHLLSSYPLSSSPSPPKTQPRKRHRSTLSQAVSHANVHREPVEQSWENWEDGEDWAENVGEEDWTGRRMGVTKAVLDVWGSKGSAGVEVS